MTGSDEHASERWRGVDAVVAAYAGTPSGHDAFLDALSALRRALPAARIRVLCPTDARPGDRRDAAIEYAPPSADPTANAAARDATLRAVDALSACGAQAALIFTEDGVAPYAPAYLCYLAGIAYRAGFETEFAGGVLSPALPRPKVGGERERHMALLAAVGLDPGGAFLQPPATVVATNRSTACGR